MAENESDTLDSIMVIIFVFVLPFILIFVGVFQMRMYIVGIPFMLYGIYGLIRKKIWLPIFWAGFANRRFFFHGEESKKVSIVYVAFGLVIFLIFYSFYLYALYTIPEIFNYL